MLFENLNMSIGEGQRVGLIAKNGTGKSTLLSIINGNEGYDSGDIIFRKGLRVGYLMQSPNFNPDESVLDACFRTTIKEEDDRAEREAKMNNYSVANYSFSMNKTEDLFSPRYPTGSDAPPRG